VASLSLFSPDDFPSSSCGLPAARFAVGTRKAPHATPLLFRGQGFLFPPPFFFSHEERAAHTVPSLVDHGLGVIVTLSSPGGRRRGRRPTSFSPFWSQVSLPSGGSSFNPAQALFEFSASSCLSFFFFFLPFLFPLSPLLLTRAPAGPPPRPPGSFLFPAVGAVCASLYPLP